MRLINIIMKVETRVMKQKLTVTEKKQVRKAWLALLKAYEIDHLEFD